MRRTLLLLKFMRLTDIVVELSICKQEHIKIVCNSRQSLDVSHCKIQVAELFFYKF